MPSASTKADVQASQEALDPIKKVLNAVDKKVRNLEKRKLKLDAYREKQESGECLEKDQQVAVDRYGEVMQNLEFARDLQKQFNIINADCEKLMKKQAKRDKSEGQRQECKRVRQILQLQGLLDSLGSDNVRQDFQTGKHGAIVLTEENLDQLDELYKLISPTRDGEKNYHESMSQAADHIVNLLDAKDKAVVGTTYKELKELLDLIAVCGYFEHAKKGDEEVKEEVTEQEFEVVLHEDVPDPESEEVQSSLPPEILHEPEVGVLPQTAQLSDDEASIDVQTQQVGNLPAEADLFFSANTQTVQQQQEAAMASHAAVFQRQRPFQEIVSEVQGSFNFLQESTIDMECKREFSPHMDPAVVAAHPMPTAPSMARPPSTHTPESLSQSGFGAAYGEQQTLDSDPQSVDPSIISQKTVTSVQSQDFTNSSFGQSARTQTIQPDILFSNAVSDNSSGTMSHKNVLGQSGKDSTLSQYEIPPSIPLPPGHESSQDSQQTQEEKQAASFHMNPNANVFQSQLYPQSEGGADEEENTDEKSNDTSSLQGGTFTNSSSNFQQSRDNPRGGRGGFRGGDRGDRGDRGGRGRGGSGGMSNGYSRGGGRGGDRNYNSNYQGGYNQRSDYRSEGYQNYGNSNYNRDREGGFKRGGGPPRGGNRGGPRGGFSRGGSRGGSGSDRGDRAGGSDRGDRAGSGTRGFGRPNFNQQQTA